MQSLGSATWLAVRETPRPLANKAQLPACVCARQHKAAYCCYVVIPVLPSAHVEEHRGRAGKNQEALQTALPSPGSAWLERVSQCGSKVVVSCALWGRLVYNTGNRKCQMQYRAFHKVSFSQSPFPGRFVGPEQAMAVVSL